MNLDNLAELCDRLADIIGSPGVSLAVGDGDELVYAYASGMADVASRVPMTTGHTFRIGSLSKVLTGIAIALLWQGGRAKIDASLIDVFPELANGTVLDPRVRDITLRQLAHMRVSFKPHGDVFWNYAETQDFIPRDGRIPIEFVLNLLRSVELTRPPGSHWSWDLTSYTILGRVVERLAGTGYDDFLKERLMGPVGCPDIEIGAVQPAYQRQDEPTYYVPRERPEPAPPVLRISDPVTPPYQEQIVQLRDANGGWIARPSDLVKVIMAAYRADRGILSRASLHLIESLPDNIAANTVDYFALGLFVRRSAGQRTGRPVRHHRFDWSAVGGLTGTVNSFGRRRDGLTWVISFNTMPSKDLAPVYRLLGSTLWSHFDDDDARKEQALTIASKANIPRFYVR